jgi:uncharacterized protein (DUF736 family)
MNIIGRYTKVDSENRQIELAYGSTILVKKYEKIKESSPDLVLISNNINVGSLWKKTSKNGNQYLSGNLLLPNFLKVFINVLFGKDENIVVLIDDTKPAGNNDDETIF